MSTKTSQAALDAVAALVKSQGTATDLKVSLINEIVKVYQAHPELTPSHIIADVDVSPTFIGRVFAAYACHKAKLDPIKVNVPFWSANHATIDIKDNLDAMNDELDRVADEVKTARNGVKLADAVSGKTFNAKVVSALDELKAAAKSPIVSNDVTYANLMALKAYVSQMEAVFTANKEKEFQNS
jgi:hypothetical protein